MSIKKKRVVAFLPAKGTSERIPSKNMKLLNGKPLFLHTLEKLCSCDFIDEVYLDSESDEILSLAEHLPYKQLKRDVSMADNNTTGDMLIHREAALVKADIYVQISCPFPFIRKETIKKGIDILLRNDEYDSVVLMKKDKLYKWKNDRPDYYVEGRIPNSFDLPDTLSETMALYMTRYDAVMKMKRRVGEKPYLLMADPIETVDVNTSEDFEMAELIAEGMQGREHKYLNYIKYFFSSADFADILSAMKLNKIITGLTLNLPEKKVFGRANTLKIRAVNEGESYKGIYEALNTYNKMQRGDIIVVENEFEDRAYFGELNANLAIRAGAAATILSGKTRDIEKVNVMDYPVFSTGYSALDIREMATFGGHNVPVVINNVTINPGDLLFADINGICVIPNELESYIIKKAMETIKQESKVLNSIMESTSAFDIYQQLGEF